MFETISTNLNSTYRSIFLSKLVGQFLQKLFRAVKEIARDRIMVKIREGEGGHQRARFQTNSCPI